MSSLKEEKHQLFLTLKKVLNEDDIRRRKETSEMNILYPPAHAQLFPLTGHIAPNNPQLSALYMQPIQSRPQVKEVATIRFMNYHQCASPIN